MARTLDGTPQKDGFYMPGEFEPHQGCWLLWPERPDTWRNGGKPAQQAYAAVAAAIAEFEPVTVGVNRDQYRNARGRLSAEVRVVEISSDDAWIRDTGPTFVTNGRGRVRGVHWEFNSYGGLNGGCYFPWDRDQQIGAKVLEIENLDRYAAPFVLEGGSIHVDGQGTLITTEECLLNPNRNPHLSRQDIENLLRAYLGVEKIIWLPLGVYMDETDGHVDNLTCFIRPGEVLLTWTDDEQDPQYERSRAAFEILSQTKDARGRKLTVHKVHQPGPLFLTAEEAAGIDLSAEAKPRTPGARLAGSYVNFYLADGGVILPQFGDPWDEPARELLTRLYPERKVVGTPSREILLGGGNIHCITQQQPRG